MASAALNLHNVEGAPGTYTAVVTATGAASVPGTVPQTRVVLPLAVGKRSLVLVPIQGNVPASRRCR